MTARALAQEFLQQSCGHVLHQIGLVDAQPSSLIRQLLEHRLALPFAGAMLGCAESITPSQNALLQLAAQLQSRHHYHAPVQVLIEVCEALRTNEIPALVLKGAAYAHSFYPQAQHRQNTDHDILVAPHHRKLAHQTLLDLGFKACSAQVFQEICGQASYRRTEPNSQVEIDLHWELGNNFALYGRFDFQCLLAEAGSFVVDGRSLLRLSDRWSAIHSALNYCCDHPAQRSFLALLDFALIAQSLDADEKNKVCLLAEQSCTWGVLHFANAQAQALFGQTLFPELAKAKPKKDPLFDALLHRFEHASFWWPLRTPRPVQAKLEFLWRQAIPPSDYMYARYGRSRSLSSLHMLRCLSAIGLIARR